jgi:hypothetical protein
MKTMVIGDIHGCGLELRALIEKAGLEKKTDQVILVGDLFDRGLHGHIVWEVIQEWGDKIHCLEGNHERKMLKWLKNERREVPSHYVWCVDNLREKGVSRSVLEAFLEKLPTLFWYSVTDLPIIPFYDNDKDKELRHKVSDRDVIIVHAGIDIENPLNPDRKYTVYGDERHGPWWEKYTGNTLILYGHLSEADHNPRIRYLPRETENVPHSYPNSIGLDGACVHGGNLHGYVIETGEIITVAAKEDYFAKLKKIMKGEI